MKYGYDGISLTGCTTAPPTISPADTNPVNYRTSMCDGSGATSWSHDPRGRVLTEQRIINGTSAINKPLTYTYYKDGELNTVSYPSTKKVTYTDNSSGNYTAGRPSQAVDTANSINYVTGATYNPAGALAGMTSGSATGFAGFTTSNTYNRRLQPLILSATAPGLSILSLTFDFHIGSGDNGNVYRIVNGRDGNRTQNFTYDALNRIQTAYTNGPNWGESFGSATSPGGIPTTPGIDAWGNLWQRSQITGKTGYESLSCPANVNNQLTTCLINHDAAGNITSYGSASYTYDAENRLISTGGDSYVYDADGNRAKKCSNTGCTAGTLYWRNSNGDPLVEAGMGGSATEEYIFFNGKRVARRDVSSGAAHYYFADHLGSTSVVAGVVNNAAVIQDESDYYPYGGEIAITNNDPNTYNFIGKERDAESGLDMFGARYYNSGFSRFMTPDWAAKPTAVPYAHYGNPQSLNLYSYVQNNPTTVGDPDGHCFPWCLALAGGGVLAEESPLVLTGPVGWVVLGGTAVTLAGVATYQHFHSSDNSNAQNNRRRELRQVLRRNQAVKPDRLIQPASRPRSPLKANPDRQQQSSIQMGHLSRCGNMARMEKRRRMLIFIQVLLATPTRMTGTTQDSNLNEATLDQSSQRIQNHPPPNRPPPKPAEPPESKPQT